MYIVFDKILRLRVKNKISQVDLSHHQTSNRPTDAKLKTNFYIILKEFLQLAAFCCSNNSELPVFAI